MSRFLLGLLSCLLVVSACQTPEPPAPVTPQSLEPSSIVATLVPFRREAWSYWPAASKPLAVYATALKDDSLWVGTNFGIWRVNPRTLEYVAYDNLGLITLLLPLENGQLWAAGPNSLFYFDGQQWSRLNLSYGMDERTYYQLLGLDVAGNLWVALEGSQADYFRFVGHTPSISGTLLAERLEAYPDLDYNPCQTWVALATWDYSYASQTDCQNRERLRQAERSRYQSVLDREGNAWWFEDKTLHVLKNNQESELPWPASFTTITPDAVEGIWLGTEGGLVRVDKRAAQPVSLGLEDPVLHRYPRNLAVDRAGTVWAVTDDGVQNLLPGARAWQTITDFGLDDYRNTWPFGTIVPAHEGGLWATHGRDLWRFGGPSVMLPVEAPLDKGCRLIRLSVDPAGNVWSPSPYCGLLQYIPTTNQWVRYEPEAMIDEVLIDTSGTVYARGQSSSYTSGPVTNSSVISFTRWPLLAVHSDRESNLVLAMNAQELGWRTESPDTGKIQFYRQWDWSSFKASLRARSVQRVHVDAAGKIWLGGSNELIVFDGQSWQLIAMPQIGLIEDITSDSHGRLYLAGYNGIAIYDPAADQQP